MCSIGETTLARAICSEYHRCFSGQCFLQKVRSKKEKYGCSAILRDVLKRLDINVSGVAEGTKEREKRFGSMKVLVVVDGIDDADQLDELAIKHESTMLRFRPPKSAEALRSRPLIWIFIPFMLPKCISKNTTISSLEKGRRRTILDRLLSPLDHLGQLPQAPSRLRIPL
ncbi:hypothetical protein C1H46_016302 [Malus baccata]|uniref:NB-ARC domain-containing protein n=1 Tax=Malus baccata TaxID=106549 RepID=A0A540MGZ5_MALBA|nr:hypothetical protein C1H46_016302 [Malus baccata]